MKQDITTIPITEVLEHSQDCFVCRLRRMLEERAVEFASGPAMMEPDVRIKMNNLGFCAYHFSKMEDKCGRLPLGLILKSRLEHLSGLMLDPEKMNVRKAEKSAYKFSVTTSSCYICDKIEWALPKILGTFFKKYADEKEMRSLFLSQKFLCLPHCSMLMEMAKKNLNKKYYEIFAHDAMEICKKFSDELYEDITAFCNMFDYRSSADDAPKNARAEGAIERAGDFLCGDLF